MGISERLLGKKNVNGKPHIESIVPSAALPGGEVRILGHGLRPHEMKRPQVSIADVPAPVVVSADDFVVARVPEGAVSGAVVVTPNGASSNAHELHVAIPIGENMHPVTNPVVDREGNVYTTYSGSRGQKVPVSIYRIDTSYQVKPFLSDLMNATGLAFDREGQMYVSSRYTGTVYRVAPNGTMASYAEGMGVATGIAFDQDENLYVGDRTGTIFKVSRDRQIFVFATLEPSVSAYHLAFSPNGSLYVAGPTISSSDVIHAIDPQGNITTFFRGLGRPQGMTFDTAGNCYVAASYAGRRGVVRITPAGEASLAISGNNLVGLAFAGPGRFVLATTNGVFDLSTDWDVRGYSVA